MLTQCHSMCFEMCSFFEGQRTPSVRPWWYLMGMQWATGAHLAAVTDKNNLLLFWYSGSQENRTGCCYKINASCFESTENILALPLFVFIKRAHLCPGFNLAAGDHYPVPTSYSVGIISWPFRTSVHPAVCMFVISCPSNLENAWPCTHVQVQHAFCTNFLKDRREYQYSFFMFAL